MSDVQRSWLLLVGYVALIAAAAPLGPGLLVALRQQHLLGHAVSAVYFGSAVLLAHYVLFDVRLSDRVAFFALALLAAVAGAFLLGLHIPEERVHFLQYGVLALIGRATLSHHVGARAAIAATLALTAAIGLADELLQGALPARHFDWRDVGLNTMGAALALAGDEALHRRTRSAAGAAA